MRDIILKWPIKHFQTTLSFLPAHATNQKKVIWSCDRSCPLMDEKLTTPITNSQIDRKLFLLNDEL